MRWTLRFQSAAALVVATGLGFAMKYYPGPGRWWVNHWGPASVAYELFFMLLVFLLIPRRGAVTPIAVGVCVMTCVLEFLQLWQPPWLQAVRSTFLGKALLGDTFSWWDLPAYPVGCVAGWFLLQWLCARHDRDSATDGRESTEVSQRP